MAVPNSRAALIDYAKRKLGEPVIEVNVDEDQVKEALQEKGADPEIISKNLAELKSIKAQNKLSFKLNKSAVAQMIKFGYVPSPHSVYENIYKYVYISINIY